MVILFLVAAHSWGAPANVRSIREWVKGDGKTDDALGVAAAFAQCKDNAFILQVDCPVFIHVGMNVDRPIFIDNGTHVRFSKNGLFIVDNVLIPTFVIANSSDIRLSDLHIEYRGGVPVDWNTGGYETNDGFVSAPSYSPPGRIFINKTLTDWLRDHRNISFGKKGAAQASPWGSPTNFCSVFMLIGSTHHVSFTGLQMVVPPNAKGSEFIPMAFSFTVGYDSDQVPSADPKESNAQPGISREAKDLITWASVPNRSLPGDIHFTNVLLDGYYMGFQGTLHNSTFTHIVARRYGDLQDADGGTIGGVGKWFAPPHLFYLNQGSLDLEHPERASSNITITDVNDMGPRIGNARDFDPQSRKSGYANSLKIGGIHNTVTHYISTRPDGLADFLTSDHLTLTDVTGTYNSSFIHDLYPGVRFPGAPHKHLTLNNVTLTDTAEDPYSAATKEIPFGGNSNPKNEAIQFNHVTVNLKRWSRPYPVQPSFSGTGNRTDVAFKIGN